MSENQTVKEERVAGFLIRSAPHSFVVVAQETEDALQLSPRDIRELCAALHRARVVSS